MLFFDGHALTAPSPRSDHQASTWPGTYQTYASPFYFARILYLRSQRYKVRSTKETSRLEARRVAEELALKICARDAAAPQEFSFKTYARRFVEKGRQLAASGERNANLHPHQPPLPRS